MLPDQLIAVLEHSSVEQRNGEYWLLSPQMDRKTYDLFKKLVNGLRGEWVKKKNAHVFLYDPSNDIANVIDTGEMPEFNPHHFFPTPLETVDDVILLSDAEQWSTPRILEPSAGDGRIARRIRERIPGAIIDCFEIDDRNRSILKEQGFNVVGRDFLVEDVEPIYDFVLMNPPFQRSAYQKHIRKAHGLLKKAGTLVSVAPMSAVQDKKFRNWVFKYSGGWTDIGSPFETTNVHCVILEMRENLPELFSEAPYGYATWAMHNVCIAVDSDAKFWHEVDQGVGSIRQLQCLIESTVNRIVTKEQAGLCLDDETLALVVQRYAEDEAIRLAEPADEPAPVVPGKNPQAQLCLF